MTNCTVVPKSFSDFIAVHKRNHQKQNAILIWYMLKDYTECILFPMYCKTRSRELTILLSCCANMNLSSVSCNHASPMKSVKTAHVRNVLNMLIQDTTIFFMNAWVVSKMCVTLAARCQCIRR